MSLVREHERRLIGSTAQRGPCKPKETKAQRKKRLAKLKAERLQLRQQLATDDDAVLTFKEWCAVNGISTRQGHRILRDGGGPIVTRLTDRKIGISRRNNRLWQESRSR
jgi:hypothetical protein